MSQQEDSLNVKLVKNSLRYLNNLTEKVNGLTPFLRSHYSTKTATVEIKHKIASSDNQKKPSRCNHCCLRFTDTLSHVNVKPEMKYRFQKKLLKKQTRGKPLTRFQELYMQKVKNLNSNTVEITCSFCNHKTTVPTEKPAKNIINPAVNIEQGQNVCGNAERNMNGKIRRKKKKRDKFCGLQETAVLAAFTSDCCSNSIANKKLKDMGNSASQLSVIMPTESMNKCSNKVHTSDNNLNNSKQKKNEIQKNLHTGKQQPVKQNNSNASFLLAPENINSKKKNKKSAKHKRSKNEIAITKPLSASLNITKKPTNRKKIKNKLNNLLKNTESNKTGSSLKEFLKTL